ncbi:NAD-dependent epimerase/dehydratase family protein [Spiribacter roseus]|uniref:NAD-dependent epimerase/dehydratase family protein n=1 Tax=Spiribacter roseus TaxID=1855875 RepID=UPI00132FFC16|nr:NAD-dependent epimerase/dehydratase family protein [Spiribacter roseus]
MSEQTSATERNVLLTGATGFVGSFLCRALEEQPNTNLRLALRKASAFTVPHTILGNFSRETDWTSALSGVDTVIHSAGRAHIPEDKKNNPALYYEETNTQATLALARQAAIMGVKRLIFLSSIGVNGEVSRCPFRPEDTPKPNGPYAHSKLKAEKGLWRLRRETGIEVVVLRPPLIYGPNAPGNFGLLVNVMCKGFPLPLAGINNKRAFVSIWNLVNLIITCLDHPNAANQIFLVRDSEEASTSEFLARIAQASSTRSHLFQLPHSLIKLGTTILGRQSMYRSLFNSLQIDDSKTRATLDWVPPLSLDEGLRKTINSHERS